MLKTTELHNWTRILMFASILALRTLLKKLFNWEQGRLQQSAARPHQ
ncbi:MAG: hypothetical protein IVW55_01690 [Chloroflexi bacterium]|nr:hypothetical protein [Chloroflexota bacterium]